MSLEKIGVSSISSMHAFSGDARVTQAVCKL